MKTLRDRVHMYVFLVTAFTLTFSFLYQRAYADIELCKYNPEYASQSFFITTVSWR